jgi:SNF2 family DNA or RNA helicase
MHVLCVSGTIMQNDWDELYAVLDLLCPNCLGEYGGFVEYYSKPIKRGQSSTASNYEKVKVRCRRKIPLECSMQPKGCFF